MTHRGMTHRGVVTFRDGIQCSVVTQRGVLTRRGVVSRRGVIERGVTGRGVTGRGVGVSAAPARGCGLSSLRGEDA